MRAGGAWEPVARTLHVEEDTIAKVDHGRRPVTARLAIRVARLIEVGIDDLLAGQQFVLARLPALWSPARRLHRRGDSRHEPDDGRRTLTFKRRQSDINRATIGHPMAKLSPVNQERLYVVHQLAGRLLTDLKKQRLTGKALERMKLIEQAVTCFEMARLK